MLALESSPVVVLAEIKDTKAFLKALKTDSDEILIRFFSILFFTLRFVFSMSRHLYKFNTAISPRHPSNRQNNSTTHRHPCVKKFQLTSVVNLALIACLVVACTGLSEGVSLGKQGVKEWEWLNMLLGGPQGSEGGEMDVGSGPDMPVQRSAQFPER